MKFYSVIIQDCRRKIHNFALLLNTSHNLAFPHSVLCSISEIFILPTSLLRLYFPGLLFMFIISSIIYTLLSPKSISEALIWHAESESHSVLSDSLQSHGPHPWNSPGQNAGMGCLFLLQGILPTQGSSPGLPHCGRIFYRLSHKGSPRILEWVPYPFSSGSSRPRNRTGVSCIADGFFTNWAMREAHNMTCYSNLYFKSSSGVYIHIHTAHRQTLWLLHLRQKLTSSSFPPPTQWAFTPIFYISVNSTILPSQELICWSRTTLTAYSSIIKSHELNSIYVKWRLHQFLFQQHPEPDVSYPQLIFHSSGRVIIFKA